MLPNFQEIKIYKQHFYYLKIYNLNKLYIRSILYYIKNDDLRHPETKNTRLGKRHD